jgi:hypothetical protein
MIEKNLIRNMQERTIVTFYFTYTNSHNHYEKNQNTKGTYHM